MTRIKAKFMCYFQLFTRTALRSDEGERKYLQKCRNCGRSVEIWVRMRKIDAVFKENAALKHESMRNGDARGGEILLLFTFLEHVKPTEKFFRMSSTCQQVREQITHKICH